MQSNSKAFFTCFPYDIRVIIYAYLEPNDAPPFGPSFSTAFRLTCRQAREEIEDKSKEELEKFLADFETNAAVNVTVARDFDSLQHITVTIPWNTINITERPGHRKTCDGWSPGYRNALHPLFALNFNKVRVHIGTEQDQDAPDHATLLDRGHVDVSMHRLMRDLVYAIERKNEINFLIAEAERNGTTTRVKMPDQIIMPSQVRARRICLSWDLRDDKSETAPVLNGKLHQSCNLGRQSYTEDAIARRQRVVEEESLEGKQLLDQDEVDLVRYPRTVFYHVRDPQRLVGQMCVQSSRRWPLCEDGFFLNEALNALECTSEYVSCMGLDGNLVRGLTDVHEEVFEGAEKEVETALWAT